MLQVFLVKTEEKQTNSFFYDKKAQQIESVQNWKVWF